MSNQEAEIANIEQMLQAASSEEEQVRLLVLLVRKILGTGLRDTTAFLARLSDINAKVKSAYAQAWIDYFHAIVEQEKGKLEEALQAAKRGLKYFIENKEQDGIRASYNIIGSISSKLGLYQEALEAYTASLALRKEIGDPRMIAIAHNNLGNFFNHFDDYPMAIEHLLESMRMYEAAGLNKETASTLNNLGLVYFKQGSLEEALFYFNQAEQYFRDQNYLFGLATTIEHKSLVLAQQKHMKEALQENLEALSIRESINDSYGIATSYGNISSIYREINEPAIAEEFVLKAIKIKREIKDKRGLAKNLNGYAELSESIGKYSQAISLASEALQISEEIKSREPMMQSHQLLYQCFKKMGDFHKALEHHEHYFQLNKELLGANAQRRVSQLHYKKDIEDKEREAAFEKEKSRIMAEEKALVERERQRSDELLLNILPKEVAEELKEKGVSQARLFESTTVLFTDFVAFSSISEQLTAHELVNELHECFKAFDAIMEKHGLEKIKTVGDAYLAAAGIPIYQEHHAQMAVSAGLEIAHFMKARKAHLGAKSFDVRVGIHSGPVVAGIVGVKKFAYDIWGDTVNTAARMEQHSEANEVNISEATYLLVKEQFNCIYRGEFAAKNKGMQKMYFVGR
jgi:adenylate cyclase